MRQLFPVTNQIVSLQGPRRRVRGAQAREARARGRRLGLLLALALLASIGLAGCGSGALLSDVGISSPTLRPTGNDESVAISYAIGQPASVWVYLEGTDGQRYTLRDGDRRLPSAEPYSLRFDGTAPTDSADARAAGLVKQLLPDGTYTVVVEARDDSGQQASAQSQVTIEAGDVAPPLVSNLQVYPATISPNADGVDDVAEITYQLPVTATVDVTITGPDGTVYPFVSSNEQEPTPQRLIWNGKTVDNQVLDDGAYGYTLRARDSYGNVVERSGTIAISGSGQPEATITYADIAPLAVMRGEVINVTMRVKNTGDVPIRTYGPPSGYEYSTEEVFSSIDGGTYTAKPGGFWRIGVDWDANSGGAAKRYPYRWAISPRPPEQWKVPNVEDLLMPGEEATVVGRIRIFQPETKMGFYSGLIQDGVGFFQDRTGRQIVEVGF